MRSSLLLAICAFICAVSTGRVTAADSTLGRDVAANCASCHGTDGRSVGGIPSLAGRDRNAIIQQVKDFRDGRRPSTIMQQLAKGYSDAEIEAAAAYFAAQKSN